MLTTTLSFANLHNHGELFANMLRATWQRPLADARRLATAHQQHRFFPKHDTANADPGTVRIFARRVAHRGVIGGSAGVAGASSCRRKSSSRGMKAFSFHCPV